MLLTQAARDDAERRSRRNHRGVRIINGRRLATQYELPCKGGHHRTSRKNDHRKTRPREIEANSAARERRPSRTAQDRETRSPPEQRGRGSRFGRASMGPTRAAVLGSDVSACPGITSLPSYAAFTKRSAANTACSCWVTTRRHSPFCFSISTSPSASVRTGNRPQSQVPDRDLRH